ncbi:MAG: PTS sugar transporter subunit IIC [Acholeplasmataceae bacterium]|nr:PTS sugar transporter subunit IIC [Acholeplasmataceae bacterium]
MKERKIKSFIMTTMNGMVYGLFATLIIAVIFQQFGKLLGIPLIEVTLYNALKAMMGVGIGMGIALSLKMDGLKMVVASVMGGIATSFKTVIGFGIESVPNFGIELVSNNDPVTTYLVVIFGILALKYILRRRTPIDILLIPMLGSLIAMILTFLISAPIGYLIYWINYGIDFSTTFAPIPMSVIIAVALGMLLTSPLSSAAIAIAISLEGVAGGAAVVGTTTQMIGFAVMSRKDNNIGMVLSIAFGTSMLQFKNILRKPIIWLPTIIASAILAPIFYIVFGINNTAYGTSKFGAGMGSSGLVGQLQTLDYMGYSLSAWLFVVIMILSSALLVYAIDLLFRNRKLIVLGDLSVNNDIN